MTQVRQAVIIENQVLSVKLYYPQINRWIKMEGNCFFGCQATGSISGKIQVQFSKRSADGYPFFREDCHFGKQKVGLSSGQAKQGIFIDVSADMLEIRR
ncbi:hypothetical protein KKI24_24820 [bacterium]|nr:hypothetical protein [bacterium]